MRADNSSQYQLNSQTGARYDCHSLMPKTCDYPFWALFDTMFEDEYTATKIIISGNGNKAC